MPDPGAFNCLVEHEVVWQMSVVAPLLAQTCTVSGGNGVATADVDTARVQCWAAPTAVTGSVSGLIGALNLNGAAWLSVSTNGSFNFARLLPFGTAYEVSLKSVVPVQACTVTGGPWCGRHRRRAAAGALCRSERTATATNLVGVRTARDPCLLPLSAREWPPQAAGLLCRGCCMND